MNTELVALRDKLRESERDFTLLQARQEEAHKKAIALTEELTDLGFDVKKDLQEQAQAMLDDATAVVQEVRGDLAKINEDLHEDSTS